MDENIFELLEEWDSAGISRDFERESEIGEKIELLRKEYREDPNKAEKVKMVGVFNGNMCVIYSGDRSMGTVWNLKYTGFGNEYDNTRMYKNDDAHIWLDYAVYE